MRMNPVSILVGALVALIVYFVLVALLNIQHEELIAGIVAILVWVGIATSWAPSGRV